MIDTDPGVDDALALLLASRSPELNVVAVSVVSGNVGVAQGLDNARRILHLAWGSGAPPLFVGRERVGQTATHVHGDDGIGGCSRLRAGSGGERYPARAPVSGTPASEAILEQAAARPGELTLVTLGPLTNAADAFRADPDRFRMLGRIVAMGGAFRTPGNVSPFAEFNIFVDPDSAQAICDSQVPLTWVSLDVTHRCMLYAEDLTFLGGGELLDFAREVTEFSMEFHGRFYGEYGCYPHDAVAVAALIWPERFTSESHRVDVETESERLLGATLADFRPRLLRSLTPVNSDVLLSVDGRRLTGDILGRLIRRSVN